MTEATAAAAPAARRPLRARTNRGRSIREEGIVEAPSKAGRAPTGRKRRGNSRAHDPFYVPTSLIPPGMSLEWKRLTVHGKAVSQTNGEEEDPAYMIEMEEQGWMPATTEQFPALAGRNTVSKTIVRKGMILMMRPVEYTDEARDEDEIAANEQVRQGLAKLSTTGEKEMERRVQKIKRSYERPPVDEE